MTEKEWKKMMLKFADVFADRIISRLNSAGKLKGSGYSESFRKTEAVLRMYTKLPENHPERARVDKAMETLSDVDYKDIIPSIYFDGMMVQELAEIYDCEDATIIKRRNKLVRRLARELFPEDVIREEVSGK